MFLLESALHELFGLEPPNTQHYRPTAARQRVDVAIWAGRVNPDRLLFATAGDQVAAGTQAVEELRDAAALCSGAIRRAQRQIIW